MGVGVAVGEAVATPGPPPVLGEGSIARVAAEPSNERLIVEQTIFRSDLIIRLT